MWRFRCLVFHIIHIYVYLYQRLIYYICTQIVIYLCTVTIYLYPYSKGLYRSCLVSVMP